LGNSEGRYDDRCGDGMRYLSLYKTSFVFISSISSCNFQVTSAMLQCQICESMSFRTYAIGFA
jgi:hypothetical protein